MDDNARLLFEGHFQVEEKGNKTTATNIFFDDLVSDKNNPDGPITDERKIDTQILTADGQTVVLGGLIRDDVQVGSTRVPILGSIPLVGKLFRTESSTKTKTYLLVFIRATIMRDDRELQGATAEKYSNIRKLQIDAQGKEGGKSIPVLPELHDKPLSPNPNKKPEAILPFEPAVVPVPSTIAPTTAPAKAE